MSVGRERLRIALVSSLLAVPVACSGGIVLMMGEQPMPDGGIGQPRIQGLAGLLSVSLAILFLLLALRIGRALSRRATASEGLCLVRSAALAPLGIGFAMIVPGFYRLADGGAEGLLLVALGGLLGFALGSPLLRTRISDFGDS